MVQWKPEALRGRKKHCFPVPKPAPRDYNFVYSFCHYQPGRALDTADQITKIIRIPKFSVCLQPASIKKQQSSPDATVSTMWSVWTADRFSKPKIWSRSQRKPRKIKSLEQGH